jgi:hypothetical protein
MPGILQRILSVGAQRNNIRRATSRIDCPEINPSSTAC